MSPTKAVEKMNTHFIFNGIFQKIRTVYEIMWGKKMWQSRAEHR